MRSDRPDISDVLSEAPHAVIPGKHAIAITLRKARNKRIHPRQDLGRHLFNFVTNRRIATDDVEIMAVELKSAPDEFCERFHFLIISGANYGVRIQPEPGIVFFFQWIKLIDAIQRFFPVTRDTANAIMCLAMSVQRDVQIQIEVWMRTQRAIHNVVDSRLYQTIRRNDQAAHSVVLYEQINDFGNVVTQSGLAAGKPEIGNWRHRARDFFNLRKGQVARLVKFFVIKAGLAKRIAARSDKQDHCAETLFTLR